MAQKEAEVAPNGQQQYEGQAEGKGGGGGEEGLSVLPCVKKSNVNRPTSNAEGQSSNSLALPS